MTKQERIEKLTEVIRDVQMENFRQSRSEYTSAEQIAKALYDAGYRMIDGEENEMLTDAVDATFRGAVLRFAEKLKQCSYCDNCFMEGKWRRYVFVEDIDEMAKKFLESET